MPGGSTLRGLHPTPIKKDSDDDNVNEEEELDDMAIMGYCEVMKYILASRNKARKGAHYLQFVW